VAHTAASSIHPANDPNLTVARINMDNSPPTAQLHISNLDVTAIQRMPTIVDFDFLPDMGRMNGNWQLVVPTGCSQVHCAQGSAQLRS
jgi:hypothetical protein